MKELIYLASLFLFWTCWDAMCLLEKIKPSLAAWIGANIGTFVLVAAIIVAFLNIKWWIVLPCLPFFWFFCGICGRIAVRIPYVGLYFLLSVFFLSLMYHTYYL